MARNPGRLPEECIILSDGGDVTGYRSVHVALFGGYDSKQRGDAPWPSGGGRPPTTARRIDTPPHAFQIKEWEIA